MNNKNIKSKHLSVEFIILMALAVFIIVYFIIGYVNHKMIEHKLRNELTDKNSKFVYKDSFKCKRCVSNCDGSCFQSETIKGCKVYHFNVKDTEIDYDMYYIKKNEDYAYQDNRQIKLNYKSIKDLFESKYSEYEIDIYFQSEFNSKGFKFDNSLIVKLFKYADLHDSLTKDLYNDIFSIINKVDYVLLGVSENLKLRFEKDGTITLTPSLTIGSGYYKFTTYNKTYDEVIASIEENRRK